MSLNINDKPIIKASSEEESKISRKLVQWINNYPDLPYNVSMVKYEYLLTAPSLAISSETGAVINKQYITGGHAAEYQFKVIYAIPNPGTSDNERLKADELLDNIGIWASHNMPDLGEGIENIKIVPTSSATMFARYENGDEDHQIFLKLTYEVI